MQNTSSLYQSIIASGNYKTEAKAIIGGVEYTMDDLASLTTERHPFGTDKPTLGLAVAGEVNITAFLPVSVFPRMGTIRVFTRVISKITNDISEWIEKGTFFIDTREGDKNYVSLHSYDAMLKADRPYSNSALDWPARDCDVVNEIAAAIGVSVDDRTWDVMTQQFPIQLPDQYATDGEADIGDYFTMRDTLAGIAGLYGGSFVINDRGKLQLLCPWDRPVETYYLTDENGNYITVGGQRVYLGA